MARVNEVSEAERAKRKARKFPRELRHSVQRDQKLFNPKRSERC